MKPQLSAYCRIKDHSVWVNGKLFFDGALEEDLSSFLAALYKKVELNYPKFFKMDKLCKLGILAAELVARNTSNFAELPKPNMALVFANAASSLESDRIHAQAISDKQNYFPSPAVFVYTLANIVAGEIAIKHKITGENAFFISEAFDATLMHDYCELLFRENSASSALCGWINADGQTADAFVYCVKNTNFKQENEGFQSLYDSYNLDYLYHS